MNTTITMDDYAYPMIRAGAFGDFNAWLKGEGLHDKLVYELTLVGEGWAVVHCYTERRDGNHKRLVRLHNAPPASVMRYLAEREVT